MTTKSKVPGLFSGVLVFLFAMPLVISAQVPALPHYFFGAVTVDGAAAPAGTTIEARVTGVLNGSFNPIITVEAGKYGDANPTTDVPRLLVQGDIAEGATIEFFVNGVKANQTAAWRSGQTTNLDLTVNAAVAPLAVSTGVVAGVGTNRATLTGELAQLGGAPSAVVNFEWGLTTAYGSLTNVQVLNTTGIFSADLSGIPADTVFHYRARAVYGQTVATGTDQVFRTNAVPPPVPVSVSTLAAGGVSTDTATLNGNLTQMGGSASVVVSFQWGTSVAYGNEATGQTRSQPGSFFAALSGLTPDITYHYRSKAVSGQAIAYGTDVTFKTDAVVVPPSSGGGGGGGGGASGSGGITLVTAPVTLKGLSGETELRVDTSGKAQADYKLRDTGGKTQLIINAGTSLKDRSGSPLTDISLASPQVVPPDPPQGSVVTAQDLGPDGATFEPPITLTLTYDVTKLLPSFPEKDLVIAFWDGTKWVTLATTVDITAKTASASVSHFTLFAVLAGSPAPAQPVAAPAVRIISPASGATLPEGDVTIAIAVQNFDLVPADGRVLADKGHVHYYMDVDIPMTPGVPAVTTPETYQAAIETAAVWKNVKAGTHTFGVQLVNSGHIPLEPPVAAMVTVTVNASVPSATTTPVTPTVTVTVPGGTAAPPASPQIPTAPAGSNTLNLVVITGLAVLALILAGLLLRRRGHR